MFLQVNFSSSRWCIQIIILNAMITTLGEKEGTKWKWKCSRNYQQWRSKTNHWKYGNTRKCWSKWQLKIQSDNGLKMIDCLLRKKTLPIPFSSCADLFRQHCANCLAHQLSIRPVRWRNSIYLDSDIWYSNLKMTKNKYVIFSPPTWHVFYYCK